MRRYYRKALASVKNGGGAIWDYQFAFAFMANGYLSIIPRERLVENQGIGIATSTHTGGYDFFEPDFSTAGHIEFPLVHPHDIVPDDEADNRTARVVTGIVPRGIIYIGNWLPSCLRHFLTTLGHKVFRRIPWLFEL